MLDMIFISRVRHDFLKIFSLVFRTREIIKSRELLYTAHLYALNYCLYTIHYNAITSTV